MRKLLRLLVACTIRNTDEYYQQGLRSVGADPANLTHDQISAWKSICKIIEADMLISAAFNKNVVTTKLEDVDTSFIHKRNGSYNHP